MKSKEEIKKEIEVCKKEIKRTYLDDVQRFYRGKIDGLLFALNSKKTYYDIE